MSILSLPHLLSACFILLLSLFIAFLTASETALLNYKRLCTHGQHEYLSPLMSQQEHLIVLITASKYTLVTILISYICTYFPSYQLFGLLVLILFWVLLLDLVSRHLATLYFEPISQVIAPLYLTLLTITQPLVCSINSLSKLILRSFTSKQLQHRKLKLTSNLLQQLMSGADSHLPPEHLDILMSIAELETKLVEDIMTPRHQMVGIDLEHDWQDIQTQLIHSLFTRILVYEQSVDNILGFVHIRRLLPLLAENKLDKDTLKAIIRPTYFIPKGTPLIQQLIHFRQQARRSAIVVDEYGGILGMLSLEDILEEIVGEFSTTPVRHERIIQVMPDGSAWVDGATTLRDINQALKLSLPTDGPKTINGLIMEYLETIPVPGMTVLINQRPMEIRKTRKNAIKTLIIYPAIHSNQSGNDHGKS